MILFVDDERRWAESYVEELELSDHQVSFQMNVDVALQEFERNRPQIELLILDIMMSPGLSFRDIDTDLGLRTGIRFYERIREQAPDLPVIIFTNVSDRTVESRFAEEKNCWFLRKIDYLPHEIAEQVNWILTQHRHEDAEEGQDVTHRSH